MSDLHIELGHVLGSGAVRVQWLLGLLGGKLPAPAPHDVAPLLGVSLRQSGSFLTTVGFWAQRLSTFEAVEADRDADGTVIVGLRDAQNRVWNLRCRVGESSPYPLEFYNIARPLPPGMRIRLGGDPDGEALAELERRCPIERGDGSRVTLVHGRSAFDRVRLAEWGGSGLPRIRAFRWPPTERRLTARASAAETLISSISSTPEYCRAIGVWG